MSRESVQTFDSDVPQLKRKVVDFTMIVMSSTLDKFKILSDSLKILDALATYLWYPPIRY